VGVLRRHAHLSSHLSCACRGLLASEAPFLGASDWASVLSQVIIPLASHLAAAVNGAAGGLRGADRSLRLCVGLLTKTLLQNLAPLRDQPAFPKLWGATLQVLSLW
jgi:hypothetical protein